jgi:putative glutamine amidotransferase
MSRKPLIGVTPYSHDNGERYVPTGYIQGIIEVGCQPLVINYQGFDGENLKNIAGILDGMVFAGGKDVDPAFYGETNWPEAGSHLPERDEMEIALLKMLYAEGKPVLGICRSLQIINVALGGSLVQHVPKIYGDSITHQQESGEPPFVHEVEFEAGSRVREIFGEDRIMINSYHHQSADRVAEALRITAKAPDGVVEALEGRDERFLVCLQWHPEKTLGMDEHSIKPFKALRKAVDEYLDR